MTKLERAIGSKIVVKDCGCVSTSSVFLHSRNQSFQIGHNLTKAEAQWTRRMLCRALVNLVNEVKP